MAGCSAEVELKEVPDKADHMLSAPEALIMNGVIQTSHTPCILKTQGGRLR